MRAGVPERGGEQQQDPLAEYDGEGCLVALNLFAQVHNVLLQRGIQELREAYPAATIAYADYFAVYLQMLGDERKLGFDGDGEGGAALAKACCGVGGGKYNVDLDRMCGAPGRRSAPGRVGLSAGTGSTSRSTPTGF